MAFRAAVIGCGMAGSGYDTARRRGKYPLSHAGAYYADKNTHLTALCDTNRRKLEEAAGKWDVKKTYMSYMKMLENEDMDILSISSPTDTHSAILEKALDSGAKVIFLEKPVSHDLAEARKMNGLIKMKKKKVAVNYRHRWNPAMAHLRRLFREGVFGKVQKVNAFYTGGLVHIGSHAIDLARWFFGEPEEALALSQHAGGGEDGLVDACFRMKSGFNFFLQGFNRRNFNIFEIEIFAEKARIRILKGAREMEFFKVSKDPLYRHLKLLKRIPAPFPNGWKSMAREAAKEMTKIAEKGKTARCTYEDGLRALELSLAALESAKKGMKRIRIKPCWK